MNEFVKYWKMLVSLSRSKSWVSKVCQFELCNMKNYLTGTQEEWGKFYPALYKLYFTTALSEWHSWNTFHMKISTLLKRCILRSTFSKLSSSFLFYFIYFFGKISNLHFRKTQYNLRLWETCNFRCYDLLHFILF